MAGLEFVEGTTFKMPKMPVYELVEAKPDDVRYRFVTPEGVVIEREYHLNRDTLGALRGAGLLIADCERFALPAGGPLLRACVQGVAKPLAVPTMPVSQAFDRGTP